MQLDFIITVFLRMLLAQIKQMSNYRTEMLPVCSKHYHLLKQLYENIVNKDDDAGIMNQATHIHLARM